MTSYFCAAILTFVAVVLVHLDVVGQEPQPFAGDKSLWRGFERFDFLLDEATLTAKPFKAPQGEGTGVSQRVESQLRCVVVAPKKAVDGMPWSWRGRYFDHEPQVEVELLKRGFHIAFIQSDDMKHWRAWYEYLVKTHGFSKKPAFVGMSGGGRNAYNWAAANPDNVCCIYADNPLITRESLMDLDQLALRDVPLLHVCGSLDPLSGNHTFPIESIYQHLGGRISVMIKDGTGHHPHSLRDPTPIADFISQSLKPQHPAPDFVGEYLAKSSFYSVENRYIEFPKEDTTYATCRGPQFSNAFDQYKFKPAELTGNVHAIVPDTTAPGKPWVLRADLAPRNATVDLALLDMGFHIVTAPRPRDPGVTLFEEWNRLYHYLVEQGFSPKPVFECSGGAAGEIYDWAIANPEKVSCIYAENPMLRNLGSHTTPIDNLRPLAKANVPLLHVCGELDPWFETHTKVAQKRYRELGGRFTLFVNKGEGHLPLAPKNVRPVLEFITKSIDSHNPEKKP